MDPKRFATGARSLWTATSRRTAFGLVLSGILGASGRAEGEAKKRKKHKKHRKISPTTCTPNCAGLVCGNDGCGGSCGTCTGDLRCVNGACCAPASSAVTCAGRCGRHPDACGQAVNCGTCPTGSCAGNPCK